MKQTIIIEIADKRFAFSEVALNSLNAILTSDDVMPLERKYDRDTETYSDVPAPKVARSLSQRIVTEWK